MSRNLFQYAGAVAGSRPGDSVRILTTAPTKGPEVPDRGLLVADCVTVEGRVFARGQMSLDASGHPPRFYGPDGATSLVILGADGVSTTTITSTSDPLSGSGSGGSSSALTLDTVVKTSAFTATVGKITTVSTAGGTLIPGLLPTAPADGAQVCIKQVLGTAGVSITCGGSDVINRAGGATSLTLTLLGEGVTLLYTASVGIWTVVDRDTAPSQLALVKLSTQAGTAYTLVAADAATEIETTNAAATTITIPPNSSVAFSVGVPINVRQYGAGQVTIAAGAGVTLRAPNGAKTAKQYATLSLVKRATDEWIVAGDTTS